MGERQAIVTLLLIAAFLAAAIELHFFGGRAVLGIVLPSKQYSLLFLQLFPPSLCTFPLSVSLPFSLRSPDDDFFIFF